MFHAGAGQGLLDSWPVLIYRSSGIIGRRGPAGQPRQVIGPRQVSVLAWVVIGLKKNFDRHWTSGRPKRMLVVSAVSTLADSVARVFRVDR